MKSVTIAEFKRNLPALLGEVACGASIVVQKSRAPENVANLGPFLNAPAPARRLGLLAKRGKPRFKDWKLTEDEFLASR